MDRSELRNCPCLGWDLGWLRADLAILELAGRQPACGKEGAGGLGLLEGHLGYLDITSLAKGSSVILFLNICDQKFNFKE